MSDTARIKTMPVVTQDHRRDLYGDSKIDSCIPEPVGGPTPQTGMMLMLHGRGASGLGSLASESIELTDGNDLVAVRVEYRHLGRESAALFSTKSFDRTYVCETRQVSDCRHAANIRLANHSIMDRKQFMLFGANLAGHIVGQCPEFAPWLWSAAFICRFQVRLRKRNEATDESFGRDLRAYPGEIISTCARDWNAGEAPQRDSEIQTLLREADSFPDDVPVAIVHSTHVYTVDLRHTVDLVARIRSLGTFAPLTPIHVGNHLRATAALADKRSHVETSIRYCSGFYGHRRPTPGRWQETSVIPATGGHACVHFDAAGASLSFNETEYATA
jgi:hypothetical protein